MSSPSFRPTTTSRGTAVRLAIRAKTQRKGTYSPKGTGWAFSTRPRTRPDGPQATISFTNRPRRRAAVTPARTVAWSRRARAATRPASAEPGSGPARGMASSGQTTRPTGGRSGAVAPQVGGKTASGGHDDRADAAAPPTLDDRHGDDAAGRPAVRAQPGEPRGRRHDDQGGESGGRAAAGERFASGEARPAGEAGSGEAGAGERDRGDEDERTPDPGEPDEGTGGLAERGAPDRQAPERPGVPRPFGERERAGEGDEPAAPRRDRGEGDGDEQRLEPDEDDVAEPGELECPDAADRELAEADEPPEEKTPAHGLRRG